jgi:CTP:molybdopterin cytidylyltransferase MocA
VQTWAIVVAAGGGTRFGGAKQFAPLGTASLVDRSVTVARSACDEVVVVVPIDALASRACHPTSTSWSCTMRRARSHLPPCSPG